jgi:hypothetical protein
MMVLLDLWSGTTKCNDGTTNYDDGHNTVLLNHCRVVDVSYWWYKAYEIKMECHTWQADWCPSVRNALLKQQDNLQLTTVLLGLSQIHWTPKGPRVTPKKFWPSPEVLEQGLMQCICIILSASLVVCKHTSSIRMDKCDDVRRGWLCWANGCMWDGEKCTEWIKGEHARPSKAREQALPYKT